MLTFSTSLVDSNQIEINRDSEIHINTNTINDLDNHLSCSFDKNVSRKIFKSKKVHRDPRMNIDLKMLINRKNKYSVKSKRRRRQHDTLTIMSLDN